MGAVATDVPRLRFSTEDLRPRDRLPFWCEVFGRKIAKFEIAPLGDQFRCDANFCVFPDLSIADIAASPVRVDRTRQMAAEGADDLVFAMVREGTVTASHLGRELTIRDGESFLFSGAEAIRVQRTNSRFVTLSLPRALLAPLVGNLDAVLMSPILGGVEPMRLLTGYLDLLTGDALVATPALRRLAATHIHDLVAMALGATRDAAEVANGRGVRAARMNALKSDIMEHLGRFDLAIGALARRHGISESYVRKLFEGEDTSFTDFVLEQRLARAHRLLCDPRYLRRTITSIAFDTGFGDLSYFNRCFRRRYGETPSAVRAQALQGADATREI
jgi:AraC-like DNA-binding protein